MLPSDEETPLFNYILAVGRQIGPSNILAASKISKQRVCIYLSTEEIADRFVQDHKSIMINDKPIAVRKLVAPSKKLILSNVHPCVPNTLILKGLRNHNIKTTSSIHNLHVGLPSSTLSPKELASYSHIASFRRGVYVEDNSNTIIPDSLLITFENESYRIFINDKENNSYCDLCEMPDHVASVCPTVTAQTSPENMVQDISLSNESFTDRLQKARETRDATLSQTNELSSDLSTARDETTDPALNPDDANTAVKPSLTFKRSHRRESAADSTNSDAIANKMLKSDPQSQTLDNIAPLSQEDMDSVISVFQPDSNFTLKFQMDLPDFMEFLSDLRSFTIKNTADKVLSQYTNDVPTFMESLKAIRSIIRDKGIKNRIMHLIKKCSSPKEMLEQECDSEKST